MDGDTTFSNYSHFRKFLLLGEEAFLNPQGYDFYLIYEFGGMGLKSMVYVLKSANGVSSISKKELLQKKHLFLISKKDSIHWQQSIELSATSRLVDASIAMHLKKRADSSAKAIHGIKMSNSVEDAYSALYYYNGKDFYYISKNTVPVEQMRSLDQAFQTSPLFNNQ